MLIYANKWNILRTPSNYLSSPASIVLNLLLIALLVVPISPSVAAQQPGAVPSPIAPDSAARLAPLTDQLRLGAEFFLNRNETEDGVRHHFQLMHKYGLTIVRVFIIWDDIERAPDQWDLHRYDWVYNAAAESGLKVLATLCAEDPPGWMKLTPFYHNRMNLNDPKLRERAAIYIQKVVGRYRNHPAQGAWLLMNEPALVVNYERSTMQVFGKWLENRYGSVDRLNQRWFQPLANFSDVQVTPEQFARGWLDYYPFIDWREFNIDNLCDFLRWIGHEVRALDTTHPTHINLAGLWHNLAVGGYDPWKEATVVDFLGSSCNYQNAFAGIERSQLGLPYAYWMDMLRSAAGAKPWWVTEIGGGPAVFDAGSFPINPTRSELARWLWDSFGAGARGVIFWMWSPRWMGYEGGEEGLVSLEGVPSPRVEAVKEIADTLARLPELAEAKPVAPRVAILYDPEAVLLMQLDGRKQFAGRRTGEPLWSLEGTHAALARAHIPVNFVHLDELKSGAAQRYSVLYVPYAYALDDQAVQAIRDYVRNGGTLWADGLLAWKNEYGEVRPRIPGGLGDVIGADAADIDPVEKPYSVTAANEQAGELWKLPLEMKGGQVFVRASDGKPFAVRNHFGKGQAIYFTSALTLAYQRRNHPQVERWIVQPALAANADAPVKMEKGSGQISFRALEGPGRAFAVLSNWGPADTVEVSFKGDYAKVVNALSGAAVKSTRSNGKTTVTMPLPAGGVLLLEAQKP